MIISQLQYLHARKAPRAYVCCGVAGAYSLFIVLMDTSASIARMLSGLDLMGGNQEALTDFIANYLEQEVIYQSYFSSSKQT